MCTHVSNRVVLLTFGAHAQRGLGLSVRVLVPKLVSRMFIRAKNDTKYLTVDADQMVCGNFAINALFKCYGLPTAS